MKEPKKQYCYYQKTQGSLLNKESKWIRAEILAQKDTYIRDWGSEKTYLVKEDGGEVVELSQNRVYLLGD